MAELHEKTPLSLLDFSKNFASEGLVNRDELAHTAIEDIGLTLDDPTLIGNAIEREFDCDLMPDEEMQSCTTVRQLVALIGRRLQNRDADPSSSKICGQSAYSRRAQ